MPRGLRIVAIILLFAAAFGLMRGIQFFTDHHATSAADVHQTVVNARATVTIVRNQDLFEPFILSVQPHTVVTWQNNDSVAHHFTTTPISTSQQHIFLNPQPFSLTIAASGYSTFVFTRPGLYHYYETAKDSWNSTFARVEAGANLRHYPMAMGRMNARAG